uniref:Uncharacterized protein n=1 Tax=Spongospora subterranea TaxID=70186 RepID=A0A0H5R695_9EUKA|eukprot:CRZ03764.1 hypothetical protein [Spongospora subterranea]
MRQDCNNGPIIDSPLRTGRVEPLADSLNPIILLSMLFTVRCRQRPNKKKTPSGAFSPVAPDRRSTWFSALGGWSRHILILRDITAGNTLCVTSAAICSRQTVVLVTGVSSSP